MAVKKTVWKRSFFLFILQKEIQLTFTCSKSTRETLEKGVKNVQSERRSERR